MNRCKQARERAGLSVAQAAKLLGLSESALERIESFREVPTERMADLYQVNVPWMLGETPEHDFANVDKIRGADQLTAHDREILAEFAASMPRREPKSDRPPRQAIIDKVVKHVVGYASSLAATCEFGPSERYAFYAELRFEMNKLRDQARQETRSPL